MTTAELMRRLIDACQSCALVASYAIDAIDEDTLSVRVFLLDESFINAFYNLATDKTAFAWIHGDRRVYGKDNAKMGWHAHPFENPEAHEPCQSIDFASFLREVEEHYRASQQPETEETV
ncbi:MAG: hypothetical protein AB1817_09610 [Chloroflexota bacterium]